jgi:hypothetical protein
MCRDIRIYAALMLFRLGNLSSGAAALLLDGLGFDPYLGYFHSVDHGRSNQKQKCLYNLAG